MTVRVMFIELEYFIIIIIIVVVVVIVIIIIIINNYIVGKILEIFRKIITGNFPKVFGIYEIFSENGSAPHHYYYYYQ